MHAEIEREIVIYRYSKDLEKISLAKELNNETNHDDARLARARSLSLSLSLSLSHTHTHTHYIYTCIY